MINRRQAIRSALCTAAAMTQWNALDAFALQQAGDSGYIDPRQTLFQPTEATTYAMLDQFFAGYRTTPGIARLLPYTAVVKNGGKAPAKAYKMSWVQNAGGVDKPLFSTLFFSHPSIAGGSAIATGWNTILEPGEYAVVTPLFLWSVRKFRRNGGLIPVDNLIASQSEANAFISSYNSAFAPRVRRDIKIGKHTAIGPNSRMTSKFQAAINCERKLAANLVASAGTPAGLVEAITQSLSAIRSGPDTFRRGAMTRYLESLQARIQIRKVNAAWASVQKIAEQPALVLQRRARVRVYRPLA